MTSINNPYGFGITPSYPMYSPPSTDAASDGLTPDATPEEAVAAELAAEPQHTLQDFEKFSQDIAHLYNMQARFEPESPAYQQIGERIEMLKAKRAEAMQEFGSEVQELVPAPQRSHMRAVSPLEQEIRRTSPEASSPPQPTGNFANPKVGALHQLYNTLESLNRLSGDLEPGSPPAEALEKRKAALKEMIQNVASGLTPEEIAEAKQGLPKVGPGETEIAPAEAQATPMGTYSNAIQGFNSEVDDPSQLNKTQLKITALQQFASTLGSMQALLSDLEPGSAPHNSLMERIDKINGMVQRLKDQMTPEEIKMADANIEHQEATRAYYATNGIPPNEKLPAETFFKFKELATIEGEIFKFEQSVGAPDAIKIELLKKQATELFGQMTPEEQRLFQANKLVANTEATLIDSQSR